MTERYFQFTSTCNSKWFIVGFLSGIVTICIFHTFETASILNSSLRSTQKNLRWTKSESYDEFYSLHSKGTLDCKQLKMNQLGESIQDNLLINGSKASVPIISLLSNSTFDKFVIPQSIAKLIHPRVLGRFVSSTLSQDCLFDVMRNKHRRASMIWDQTRYVVYQCSGGCGGFGDRMKGIFSVLFHAIAIGYAFRIEWDKPVSLYPEILVPAGWLNWTEGRTAWSTKGHFLNFMDTGSKPYGLCTWRNKHVLKIKTNGNPIPQGHIDCDYVQPKINEILLNQTVTQSCIQTAANKWTGGTQCMGCIWWYLFRIGKTLQRHLAVELNRLVLWKKRRNLHHAFAIGLHVRAGDSSMRAGRGREAKNIDALVHKMQLCFSNFSKGVVSEYFAVIVSDNARVKSLIGKWPWLHVYAVRTKPFHIDKNMQKSKKETLVSVVSVLVDLFVLSFQDALLLSGTSGYGYLAQGVGMFIGNTVIQCEVPPSNSQ